ncbi:hypothetical protein BABINDRAFT_162834 [Babjeviella inositovora NRRL Y-12698]|uniref:MATE efflux family protein n=1 Tax=Babjeviella inositovora NRRL Y-12698 TaxID=984486 RepID=A0A1E3QM54_9ASCO|nr:uncharacterized protein BABINDRAFT_162834 [Babjeviella inositovora NRRL Y-12698]ODQ78162.1 hypothetical protein BABINDRAFT_162834 [Babjeviella inositovora NRRL Y-12698]
MAQPQTEANEGSLLLSNELSRYDSTCIHQDLPGAANAFDSYDKMKDEVKFIVKSSIPMIVTFFLQYCIPVISVLSVGHLGSQELAAASLSIMSFSITGISIFQGMTTSLDTLCAQAYGAGRYHLVGIYFQRCSVLMLSVMVFLALIWWFSGTLLSVVVPDRELCFMAESFMRVLAFGAPGLIFFESGKRFLQAQKCFHAGTYVLVAVLPLNILLQYVLVWHPTTGMGFLGAPLAMSITYWMMALLLLAYVLFIDGKACWGGLAIKQSFTNWWPMISLAFPGVVMVEAEFLAFEILTILASQFGTEFLAAQSIVANTSTIFFQIPFGISVAVSTRMAHCIGGGFPEGAKRVVKISACLGVIISTLNCLAIAVLRKQICRLFSLEPEVVQLASHVLLVLAVNQLVDGLNVTFAGCLRGQGRQRIGSIWNLASYYLVALPLCYVLAFKFDMKLYGLWIGLGIGVGFLALCEGLCIFWSNWPQIMIDAEKRNQEDS